MDDDRPQPPETTSKRDSDLPNFRQLAHTVYEDPTLADPFSDGIDEDNPAESRDALRVILTKHFGYEAEDVEDIGDDALRFIGKDGKPMIMKLGADSSGETYLDFTAGVQEKRRLFSASLKLGAPIAFALAHQGPKQLGRIYDDAAKAPHVIDFGKIEVTKHLPGGGGENIKTFILRGSQLRQDENFPGSMI